MTNSDDTNPDDNSGNREGPTYPTAPVSLEQVPLREHSAVVEEQNKANQRIGKIATKYSSVTGQGGKITYQQEKIWLESGLDGDKLNLLPGRIREFFVRSYSTFYPPERRLEQLVEGTDSEVSTLVSQERSLMSRLYGPNYDRLSTNGAIDIGGLHGEYQKLAQQICSASQDLLSVKEEMKETSARRQELERKLESCRDLKEQSKIHTHYIALGIDLSRYATLKAQLAGALSIAEENFEITTGDIRKAENELTSLQRDICVAGLSVQKIKSRVSRHVERQTDYQTREKLQGNLKKAQDMVNSRTELEIVQERVKPAAPQHQFNVNLTDNPQWDDTEAESERESQEFIAKMEQRAEEIIKKPQSIVYHPKGQKP